MSYFIRETWSGCQKRGGADNHEIPLERNHEKHLAKQVRI